MRLLFVILAAASLSSVKSYELIMLENSTISPLDLSSIDLETMEILNPFFGRRMISQPNCVVVRSWVPGTTPTTKETDVIQCPDQSNVVGIWTESKNDVALLCCLGPTVRALSTLQAISHSASYHHDNTWYLGCTDNKLITGLSFTMGPAGRRLRYVQCSVLLSYRVVGAECRRISLPMLSKEDLQANEFIRNRLCPRYHVLRGLYSNTSLAPHKSMLDCCNYTFRPMSAVIGHNGLDLHSGIWVQSIGDDGTWLVKNHGSVGLYAHSRQLPRDGGIVNLESIALNLRQFPLCLKISASIASAATIDVIMNLGNASLLLGSINASVGDRRVGIKSIVVPNVFRYTSLLLSGRFVRNDRFGSIFIDGIVFETPDKCNLPYHCSSDEDCSPNFSCRDIGEEAVCWCDQSALVPSECHLDFSDISLFNYSQVVNQRNTPAVVLPTLISTKERGTNSSVIDRSRLLNLETPLLGLLLVLTLVVAIIITCRRRSTSMSRFSGNQQVHPESPSAFLTDLRNLKESAVTAYNSLPRDCLPVRDVSLSTQAPARGESSV